MPGTLGYQREKNAKAFVSAASITGIPFRSASTADLYQASGDLVTPCFPSRMSQLPTCEMVTARKCMDEREACHTIGGAVRTAGEIILIIFGQCAHTKEGRLQVEMAQIEYDLPRLARQWSHLSRQKGSVQQRGEGEKQIEVDRRMLRREKEQLQEDLEHVRAQRQLHRDRRKDTGAPVVALVGYTNAGKSTLLNRLASTSSLAEDKLFATLDPMTRRVRLTGGQEFLLTDTVGFVH
jgi:GTP-binding protein HflX